MFNLKNLIIQPYKYAFKILHKISSNSGRITHVQVLPSGETIAFESDAARGLHHFKSLKNNDILDLGPQARVFVFDFLTCLYSSSQYANKPHFLAVVEVKGVYTACRTEKIKILHLFDSEVFYQELFKLIEKEYQKMTDTSSKKFLRLKSLMFECKFNQNKRIVGDMYYCLYNLLEASNEKLREHNEILLKLLAKCYPEIFEYD
jgi:hypothetical protein